MKQIITTHRCSTALDSSETWANKDKKNLNTWNVGLLQDTELAKQERD